MCVLEETAWMSICIRQDEREAELKEMTHRVVVQMVRASGEICQEMYVRGKLPSNVRQDLIKEVERGEAQNQRIW